MAYLAISEAIWILNLYFIYFILFFLIFLINISQLFLLFEINAHQVQTYTIAEDKDCYPNNLLIQTTNLKIISHTLN